MTEFVKCQVCGAAMRPKVAQNHLAAHAAAGDLIRAAHKREQAER